MPATGYVNKVIRFESLPNLRSATTRYFLTLLLDRFTSFSLISGEIISESKETAKHFRPRVYHTRSSRLCSPRLSFDFLK